MDLVIVESPNKIKKLSSFLGPNFKVMASAGHIRDMPQKELGYNIKDGRVLVNYDIDNKKKKLVSELRSAAKSANNIYLATDPDREGEAIAWHLMCVLSRDLSYKRIAFSEITKAAVSEAISNCRDVDFPLVNAQQARRVLDRSIGFRVSPMLWDKLTDAKSAGRVQSVVVRMIVENERAIKNFKPTPYFSVKASLVENENSSESFDVSLEKLDGKAIGYVDSDHVVWIKTEDEINSLINEFKTGDWVIKSIETKKTKKKPFPPFISSTLVQAASVKLHLSTDRTMSLAQKLFEDGHITYIRTDAPAISDEALDAVRGVISQNFSSEYLPPKPFKYSSGGNAQEAHECIRPTHMEEKGEGISDPDQRKLYELIWKQFVACQMSEAQYFNVTCRVKNGRGDFVSRGRLMTFDGWTKLMGGKGESSHSEDVSEEDQAMMPVWISEGKQASLSKITSDAKSTTAPSRFSEASLIKTLEREGIGRPATYASITKTITRNGYVSLRKRKYYAESLGEKLTDMLVDCYGDSWMDIQYTRKMEFELDKIAEGKKKWDQVIINFDEELQGSMASMGSKYASVKKEEETLEYPCPNCGGVVKSGRYSYYCSGGGDCKMKISKEIAKKKIPFKNVVELLTNRKTSEIKGFAKKKGGKFDAPLKFNEDWVASFSFK